MFRVKICGITSLEDARASVEAGADAIGLNFYAASPRFVQRDRAAEICNALGKRAVKVGVFVNASARDIRAAARELGLDVVQLHGDEDPQLLAELRGLAVMKAFRVRDDLAAIEVFLRQCHRLACLPRLVLLDADRAGQYGGTGATLDWQMVARDRARLAGAPLVLAGGLNPENVAAAVAAVRPWAIDVASGVESSPGHKSTAMVQQFVSAAKAAFDARALPKR